MILKLNRFSTVVSSALLACASFGLNAQPYDVGATDKEIKIGNTNPYSGPFSAYGSFGKAQAGYFKKVNDEGGINGRKINFITVDDSFSPPKTLEQARKLVEQEKVLFFFAPLGTAPNSAIHKYMNQKKVPQLFVQTGASKWGDPKNFPWTMGWQPNYISEGKVFAQAILDNQPNAKIALLYQNDDSGKDLLAGLEAGLGAKKDMLVARETYETTDPTVDSQIVKLKASGADVFIHGSGPKFAAQGMKKIAELSWKPTQYVWQVSSSIGGVLAPAGIENTLGLITSAFFKDPSDPQWKNDKAMLEYQEWFKKYMPGSDPTDGFYIQGYINAQTVAHVIKQAGNNLTRENIMKQAASINDLKLSLLLPGVNVQTSSTDFYPIERMQLARFDGKAWVLFGKTYGD
jgi:ABC-type branched-subunit amino acid transport system substrate-binding protein